ncbi:Lysophospholipase L1 [Paenibacillus algorifonticola]|uniref:Lysophospholipase L1 n=1 Tax=Paenibacillus algorifonticola TaxID=684063 RepID=A0A1I2HME2_9BACL|nr:rhamnogalacturonan acetylesterase [Paenibacillus algorifonticola]SFF29926.1 Lysophospholipase L1 [Paenibacillus algorifonticola]
MTDVFRFDFGIGAARDEHVKVTDSTLYEPDRGYGFSSVTKVAAKSREEAEGMGSDFCIPVETSFLLDVENGVYTVNLLIGDAITATETTIKAGCGRLVAQRLRTVAGEFIRYSFSLSVRDGQIRLAFTGLAPRINALEVLSSNQTVTVFLAGDSTVTDQPEDGYPYAGWGQMLPKWFKQDAAIENRAVSGRSSKSFIGEGRLDEIWQWMKPRDVLIIQFGHNDQKPDEERRTEPFTTYKEYLKRYIDGARQREALPVLVTSVQRRFYEADGRLIDTHGDYLIAMRELAEEENVPLIDLAEESRKLFEELGPEATKSVFMWAAPGEFMNFPNGVEDNTHFQERGALQVAGLVVEQLKQLRLGAIQVAFR